MAMPLTPALQINASPPATDKSSATATPDTSFNHVLSNELTQQQNAKAATPAANPPATQTATTDKSKKSADASQPADAGNATAAAPAPLPPISAQLLAMMGSYAGQGTPSAAPTAPAGTTGATATAAATAKVTLSPAPFASPNRLPEAAALTTPLSVASTAAKNSSNVPADLMAPQAAASAAPTFADTLKAVTPASNDAPAILLQSSKNQAPLPVVMTAPLMPNPMTIANLAQSVAPATGSALSPSVGTTAWHQALGEKVVWMSGSGEQTASLSLNPPDLGPLQIVLNVTNNQANATFIAAQPEVRLAIEAALPKLHEMMNNAGIQLGQTHVRSDTPGQQDRQAEAQSFRPLSGVRAARSDPPIATAGKILSGKGLVNTFV